MQACRHSLDLNDYQAAKSPQWSQTMLRQHGRFVVSLAASSSCPSFCGYLSHSTDSLFLSLSLKPLISRQNPSRFNVPILFPHHHSSSEENNVISPDFFSLPPPSFSQTVKLRFLPFFCRESSRWLSLADGRATVFIRIHKKDPKRGDAMRSASLDA